NTCAWAGPDGALPYALDGSKRPITEWFDPSDQALWSLWLAAEYLAATNDVAAFAAPAPFHPTHEAAPVPLVDHLVNQFRDLIDRVGVGEHGHIRIRNADWNDSALTLAPIDRDVMEEKGESVLNSAMAAWVLPRFAGLLRRLGVHAAVAAEADERAEAWRVLVASEWNGRWFRRAYGPGAVVGDDDLWLEVQPWAVLCGAASPERAKDLLATIDGVVRAGSPLGARVRGPAPIVVPEGRVAGEGSAGGVWFSINMTLAWAAAAVDPDLAWDELRRMTLANHVESYPAIWEGTLSGPDAYNTPESPRPGATWAWPDRGMGMQSFPVNNLHAHAQVVFTYLRLLGVEPTTDCTLRPGDARRGTFRSQTFEV
ncbi:MAG: cellobiose phosphorylase, partial [Actinomycetota bacterium]